MRKLLAFLAVLLVAPGPALGKNQLSDFEKRVDSLRGYWFADSGSANQRVVLQVANVLNASGAQASVVAYWGNALKSWRGLREAVVTEKDGQLVLRGDTVSSAKLVVEQVPGGTLAARVTFADGRSFQYRLQSATLPQIHEWIARNPVPAVRATRDSAVELVYLTAVDCPNCRGWEMDYLQGHAPKAALGWKGVQFTEVMRGTYKATVPAGDFPVHLRGAIAKYLKERGWSYFQGTPQWVLFVNGKVRTYTFGTRNFDSLIHPAIRAAVAERNGAGAS